MLRLFASLIALSAAALGPARAQAVQHESAEESAVEALIQIDGVDGAEFSASLAQRLRRSVSLAGSRDSSGGSARLELSFDAWSGTARLAYHDGASDAPALVVVAKFAGGAPPNASWFLAQAEAAIQSFGSCESMVSAPTEILDPWSPSETARAQRWAEVLDPWLGCAVPPSRAARAEIDDEFFLLEGEVLDPWSEAAYAERGVALIAPRPGIPSRALNVEKNP